MKDLSQIKETYTLPAIIESLLFVAAMPVSITQIAAVLDESPKKISNGLEQLEDLYVKSRGLRIQRIGNKIQLITAPDFSFLIENFMGIETTSTLSQASLETLAIIAFRQPITRPLIEEIRGVNSDGVVRNLLSKGLIEERGREDGIGRPILYGTTADFLTFFGLTSIKDLPPFEVPMEVTGEEPRILKD